MLDRTDLLSTLARFIGAGVINTIFSFAIFQASLFFFSHTLSYAISWLAGLVFVILFYPSRVFRDSHASWKKIVRFMAVYLMMFFMGSIALDLLVKYNFNPRIAIIIVIVMTTLINFLAGRRLFPAEEK